MAPKNFEIFEDILEIPDIKITNVEQTTKEIHIYFELMNESCKCPNCNSECNTVHQQIEKKEVRDCQILGKKTFLYFKHRRFYCTKCKKTFMERFKWLDSYGRYTQRFADWLKDYGLKIDLKNLCKFKYLLFF